MIYSWCFFFFFQAEDGMRDLTVTGVQTCALPIFLFAVDLLAVDERAVPAAQVAHDPALAREQHLRMMGADGGVIEDDLHAAGETADAEIGRASCRERV